MPCVSTVDFSANDRPELLATRASVAGPAQIALMVRWDARDAFEKLGWTSVDAVMESTLPTVMRRVKARDNCWIDLDLVSTAAATRCYLKRHTESHPLAWAMTRLLGRTLKPAGKAEAEAVTWCAAAETPAMETVAAGWQPAHRPWKVNSFFVSAQVAGRPADQWWTGQENCNPKIRCMALAALADTARRFHGAGLFHRDFYWCHFFIEVSDQGCVARLIDLQRVLRKPWLRLRWQLKDLGQFVFSMPADLTKAERRYWFTRYLGRERMTATDRVAWLAVRVRAQFYRVREWMG